MNCKYIKDKFPDYLTGEIDKESGTIVKNHVASCASCRRELENLTETWIKLDVLPEEQPGERLGENFYAMLESYKAGLEQVKKTFSLRPVYQFAFTFILLLTGFTVGLFFTGTNPAKRELGELRLEVRDLRQSAALAMLKQQSPSERIRGVIFTSRVEDPDKKILEALIDTLDNDPNVNVRLSAVDALYLFSNVPFVKEGLIRSLARQQSPLLQIALIDLISAIREKRAVRALKDLIKQEKLNPAVKKQAELSIQELI